MAHAIRKGGLNESTFSVIDFVFAQVGLLLQQSLDRLCAYTRYALFRQLIDFIAACCSWRIFSDSFARSYFSWIENVVGRVAVKKSVTLRVLQLLFVSLSVVLKNSVPCFVYGVARKQKQQRTINKGYLGRQNRTRWRKLCRLLNLRSKA